MTDPDKRAVRESLPGGGTFPVPPPASSVPTWYAGLLESVSQRVAAGCGRATAAVNQELTATYWAIGRDILDRQSEQGWGAKVIDRLSADLQQRFPGARGFSPRNLEYMRSFAQAWLDEAIVQAPLAQLPWYHHIALLTTLDQPDARVWYAAAAVENGWSRNPLAHHISARLIDRAGKQSPTSPPPSPPPAPT